MNTMSLPQITDLKFSKKKKKRHMPSLQLSTFGHYYASHVDKTSVKSSIDAGQQDFNGTTQSNTDHNALFFLLQRTMISVTIVLINLCLFTCLGVKCLWSIFLHVNIVFLFINSVFQKQE